VRGSTQRLLLSAALVLFVLAVTEIAALVFFTLARDRFRFAEPELYTVPGALDARSWGAFDAELGWTRHYETPYGERPRPGTSGPPIMMVFGESHTHGDEVGDAETWEAYAGTELGADVLNFGVGGYGPDQALLRFRRISTRLRTPIVGLGVTLENINRVVNRYRPFYFRQTGITLPKPRFVLEGGHLALLPNPIHTANDLARLAEPGFIAALGRDDFFYSRGDLPRLGFPYSRLLLSPAIWRQAFEARRPRGDADALPTVNLWRNEEARGIFFGILDQFVRDARGARMQPVLILLPGRDTVRARRQARGIPGYNRVLRHCKRRRYSCFDGVEALAKADAPAQELFAPGGHPSARGNEVLGRALAAFLRQQGLAPRAP